MVDHATDSVGTGTRIAYGSGDDETHRILEGVLIRSTDGSAVASTIPGRLRHALDNYGTLAGIVAVNLIADASSLVNRDGAKIVGIGSGVVVTGASFSLDNAGFIAGLSTTGVDFLIDAGTFFLRNTGTIHGHTWAVAIDSNVAGTVVNGGLIQGDQAGVRKDGTGNLTLTNRADGVIRGRVDAIMVDDEPGALKFTNRGLVDGDIRLFGIGPTGDVIVSSGRIAGDVIMGDGSDRFEGLGGKAANVAGGPGDDRLSGGAFRDRFSGNAGNDTMNGRGGPDLFIFDTAIAPTPNVDRINGFAPNADKVVLDNDIFPAGDPGTLAAFRFHSGAAASTPAQRINYNPGNGWLTWDANGSAPGGPGPIHFATLPKHLALDRLDFLLVE